jgi:hypothetical protein
VHLYKAAGKINTLFQPVHKKANNHCTLIKLSEVTYVVRNILLYLQAVRLNPSMRVLADMFLEKRMLSKIIVLYIFNLSFLDKRQKHRIF